LQNPDTTFSIHAENRGRVLMSKADKLVARMRLNPRDWRMDALETIAARHGIEVRKRGGSHFVFLHPDSELALTIPFKRPIKPVYIRQFLNLLDDIENQS
jgi:predicted RNA binding protein YcfA (HicA-like mRNA interferase family)